MKIAEIFYSIQGEGALLGVPSVFIRTSGCNLRCTWCDTPYTSWKPEGENAKVSEIVERAKSYGAKYVVVTGGEPMMFEEIVELTRHLRSAGFHITIETAGTIWQHVQCDLMSISPKLANSTPHEREEGRWAAHHDRLRLQFDVLRRLTGFYRHQLKFVVAERKDIEEIEAIVRELDANPAHVILMPEGTNADILRERAKWIVEICKEKGYRFSPRLHVDIWGDERGR